MKTGPRSSRGPVLYLPHCADDSVFVIAISVVHQTLGFSNTVE
jgi:hypothetical protein